MSNSGRFVLRLDPELHGQLKKQAVKEGVSLNQLIVDKLSSGKTSQFGIIRKVFKDRLVGIVLFGSHVRNEERESSDIDLLLVLSEDSRIERELYSLWDEKVQVSLGEKYSPQFVKIPKEPRLASSIWLEVALEGVILYERGLELRKFIFELKHMIASGVFRRQLIYGQPYWVRGSHAE